MEFYEPFIMWRAFKKIDKEAYQNVSWRDFYSKHISWSLVSKGSSTMECNSLSFEQDWLREGCPYYKIWPGVFDQFVSTRMDIDTKFLKPPHESFAIYFPKLEEPLLSFKIKEEVFFVRAIIVQHITHDEMINGLQEAKELLSMRYNKYAEGSPLSKMRPEDYKMGIIKIRIEFSSKQFSERYLDILDKDSSCRDIFKNINPPGEFFRNIPILPDTTIEKAIGEFVDIQAFDDSDPSEKIPASIIESCFRIIIGIYFVSTGSQKVLEYDVLARHLEAYRRMREDGDNDGCIDYERRAKAKGKYGWNVGADRKDRHLILPKGMTYDEAMREAGSRELLYQHTRGGHWHLYWVGTKVSQQPIVKWVEETTVRPDLPIRPIKK